MSGMHLPSESLDSKMSNVNYNEIDNSERGNFSAHNSSMAYLKSLLCHVKHQNTRPHHVFSYNSQASVNQVCVRPRMPLSGNMRFGRHGRGYDRQFGPGDSHKRLRENAAGQW